MLRQDTWTGRSWRFADNEWKSIVGVNRDWDSIDKALLSALRIPFAEVNTDSALKRLHEKHPVLKDLPNDELLERIKLVYSQAGSRQHVPRQLRQNGTTGEIEKAREARKLTVMCHR